MGVVGCRIELIYMRTHESRVEVIRPIAAIQSPAVLFLIKANQMQERSLIRST